MSDLTYPRNAPRSDAAPGAARARPAQAVRPDGRRLRPLVWDAEHIRSPIGASAQVEAAVLLRRLQRNDVIPGMRVRSAVTIAPKCQTLRVPGGGPSDLCSIVFIIERDAIVILGAFRRTFLSRTLANACRDRLRRFRTASNGHAECEITEFIAGLAGRRSLKGWVTGDGCDFIGVLPDVVRLVELRIGFSAKVRNLRLNQNMTQLQLAERLGSSQSRVAKLEGGDPSVSFELLMRALIIVGATDHDITHAVITAPGKWVHKRWYWPNHKPRADRMTSIGAGLSHQRSNAAAP